MNNVSNFVFVGYNFGGIAVFSIIILFIIIIIVIIIIFIIIISFDFVLKRKNKEKKEENERKRKGVEGNLNRCHISIHNKASKFPNRVYLFPFSDN